MKKKISEEDLIKFFEESEYRDINEARIVINELIHDYYSIKKNSNPLVERYYSHVLKTLFYLFGEDTDLILKSKTKDLLSVLM